MTVVDLDKLQADCRAEIDRMQSEVARLALAGSPGELQDAEDALARFERRLISLGLAGADQERQEAARLAAEERERRAASLKKAQALQGKRGAAARKVDEALSALMAAVNGYVDVAEAQQAAFADAGMPAAVSAAAARGFNVEGAFAFAMQAWAPRFRRIGLFERLPVLPVSMQGPLAERDIDMRGWKLPGETNETEGER